MFKKDFIYLYILNAIIDNAYLRGEHMETERETY